MLGKNGKTRGAQPRRSDPPALLYVLLAGLACALVACGGFVYLYKTTDLPDPNADFETKTSFVYYDNGKGERPLGQYAIQNRDAISYDEMPQDIKDAVVAAENRTFWSDSGIDYKGIVRALFNNAAGNATQGASTITQQYIKILYLTQERSYTRKLKEAILSLKLGKEVSKQEILEGYLNTIYFGRGAYGIQAAAKAYFDKDATDLEPPGVRDPGRDHQQPEPVRPRRRQGRQEGAARAATATSCPGWPGREDHHGRSREGRPQAAEVLPGTDRRQVRRPGGPRADDGEERARHADQQGDRPAVHRGGDRRRRPADHHDVHQEGHGCRRAGRQRGPRPRASSSATRTSTSVWPASRSDTGAVRGMYAGQDYLESEINWAVAGGQAGSSVKPFALAAASRPATRSRTPSTATRRSSSTTARSPERAGHDDYGSAVNLLKATEDSINTAFTDLTVSMPDGPQEILEKMNKMGIPPNKGPGKHYGFPRASAGLDPYPSITLGSATISPINLANAYATIANGGRFHAPYIIEKVASKDGEVLYDHSESDKQAIDQEQGSDIAADVSYALQQVVQRHRYGGPGPRPPRCRQDRHRDQRPRTRSTRRGSPATRRSSRPRSCTSAARATSSSTGGCRRTSVATTRPTPGQTS